MDLSKEIYSALKMILLHVQGVISLTQQCSESYHKNRYIFGNYWTTLCASNKIIKSRIHFFLYLSTPSRSCFCARYFPL